MQKRAINSLTFRELISLMKMLNGNAVYPMSIEKLYENLEPLLVGSSSFSFKTLTRRIKENSPGKQFTPSFIFQVFDNFLLEYFYGDESVMMSYILGQLESEFQIDISQYLLQKEQGTATKDIYNVLIDDISRAVFFSSETPQKNLVQLCTYEELQTKFKMSADQIAGALVANDYSLYKKLTEEHEGTVSIWSDYLSFYPETFRYLVANGKIVGNWSFMVLTPEQVNKVLNGTFQEVTCLQSNSPFLFICGDYNGFMLNFSVNEAYRTAENYHKLFNAFADELLNLARHGVFFDVFYTHAFAPQYRPVYEALGFEFRTDIKTTLGYASVGILTLNTRKKTFPSALGNTSPELRSLYHAHFKENANI